MIEAIAEMTIEIQNTEYLYSLFGDFDENLKLIEKAYGVSIVNRGSEIKITGTSQGIEDASVILKGVLALLEQGELVETQTVRYLMSVLHEKSSLNVIEQLTSRDCICLTMTGKPVKAKTVKQKNYVDAMKGHTVVFGVGPAGTGKTYLAVAMAVQALKSHQVNRIVLTRPAVEAGESLGFLPGDLQTKVDPYLRPLYDALFEMLGEETFQRQLEKGTIEVAPLAYMRGRSLNDSFIILDEAQNTTSEQMKMFLTRLGLGSKAVITGDITQIDLPMNKRSGLVEAIKVLKDVGDIKIMRFSEKDVVRSKIVQEIIKAYEQYHAHPSKKE